jgi:hypothetical protein
MRSVTLSQTGVGYTNGYVADNYISPFNIGFGVAISGAVTYTVQHTFDGFTWFDHPTVAAQTANADGNYAFPVQQVRLSITAGLGSAALTLIQAGPN